MKKISIAVLVVIASFSVIFLSKGEENMTANINLILKAAKETYLIGDEINLTYTFLNENDHSIYLLPWGGHYTTNWIVAYNEQDVKLADLPLVRYEIKFIPLKEDFVFIGPKKSYSITIKGKVIKSEFSRFDRKDQKKYKGFFIDFNNSAIFLEKSGDFTIKAFYDGKTEWRDKGKELYGLNNILVGKLESNEIKIIIKNKRNN
ncbi:MAG: hypothetical protein Q8O13_07975 [Candidatus Omnitrophota bacterium]|nr:hypothetical protein [Candidatus Omnitrophota bacterium]